ncbi:MAG TPA: PASTA domain-containing protein [Solirubrobacter sp.]|nr:PASTA domain-containing protein [Solirubrobacter sp.]
MHLAPDTIVDGRYRAERRLGSGGMGEVWCAEDEVLGRLVALKLLGSRFAEDPEFRERFRREARAAAGLAHPNIVGIFDRSEWDGTPYIAMELVDGKTLKDLVLERGPLPPDVATGVMVQILRALGFAHRRGIVHRDVKPQNVIIDAEGTAKVADFGIARAGGSEMTETGAIVGTVQYLSPEQAEGRPVDRRSDLYSAGIVLYELLTGRLPFDGEAPVSIAIKQINERPAPPSQLRPGLPPALEAVVLRALEKDPAQRFQSADEFIAALEAARRAPTRAAVVAAPVVEERGSRWWVWLLALVALLAIAAGLWFLLAGDRVTVPNVVGRDASEAADRLHNRGLEVAFKNVVDDDTPRDEVMEQDPAAGDEVREGTTITLTVSAGRDTAAVPAVVGQSQEDAEQALRDAGFKSEVEQAFSDSVPAGDVISSSPAAGKQITKGQTVTLTVSQGAEGVEVPDLRGAARADAEAQLQELGLTPDVSEKESTKAAGTVLAQGPAPGTSVDKGATVSLTVAKERPQVPDVTSGNPTVEEATQTLEDAGYKVNLDERPSDDPALAGRVIGQRPDAGTRRSTGGTVTLVIVPAAPTPTPTPTSTAG